MVNLRLPWVQEPCFFIIHVKTMANVRKGTWNIGENIRCVGGGEIITDIKTCYYPQHPKKFHRIKNVAYTEKNDSLNLIHFFKVSGCNQLILATFK